MKKIIYSTIISITFLAGVMPAFSQEATSPSPTATADATAALEKRVAGLEAYINNVDPAGSKVEGVPGPGHNAWIMMCAALVLFMTLPGLALFYGGLVRSKNVLSVLAQCLGIAGLVTILWWICGYSLVFGTSFKENFLGPFLGGSEFFFLKGVGATPNTNAAYWISQSTFCMYQLMFAIITPALIIGAIAERMKFFSVLTFVALWMFLIYFPLAHMVWGASGLMNGVWNADAKIAAIDFAGGTVVHMSAGWSALILCLMLGKRIGFRKEPMPPHSMVLCMVGTGMLWVGWYGFNAGSALAADGIAANAFMTTTIATAVASFTWAIVEYIHRKTCSVLGFCSGAVAGLVTITPACGFVNSTGAVIIGILAGVVPFFACTKMKEMLGYDDALDTFGVHAIGGTMGALLTGLLATGSVNPNLLSEGIALKNGLAMKVGSDIVISSSLWLNQLKAMAITIVMSVVASVVITLVTQVVIGLRPAEEVEREGLDTNEHGEKGYVL